MAPTPNDRAGDPELEAIALILVGQFNPSIFQPAWFGNQKLLRDEEAKHAQVEVIVPEAAAFKTEQFAVQVTLDRFAVVSDRQDSWEALRDLVKGTFQLLSHTPVARMGLNRSAHFRVYSEEDWTAFGHRLVPKDFLWSKVLQDPRTLSMMVRGARSDHFQGSINVKVEPSAKIKSGVFVDINDHCDFSQTGLGAREMVQGLDTLWGPFLRRSEGIINAVREAV